MAGKGRYIPAISEEGKAIGEDFEDELSEIKCEENPVHGITSSRPPLRLKFRSKSQGATPRLSIR